jgi:nucleotide-binding universal stress UspA family protein
MFVSKELIDNYFQELGKEALRSIRTMLDNAGVPYISHIEVGHIAETITNFTKKLHCEQIVMRARGRDSVSGLLLGAAAVKVLHLAEVPVIPVKK